MAAVAVLNSTGSSSARQ